MWSTMQMNPLRVLCKREREEAGAISNIIKGDFRYGFDFEFEFDLDSV